MNTTNRRDRNRELGSMSVWAIGLAVALVAAGGVAAVALEDGPAPAAEQLEAQAAERQATQDEAAEAAPVEIDWHGEVPAFICAPSGPNACMGISTPGADDRKDTAIETNLASAELTMTWDPVTPATMVMEIALVSGHTECDGRCFYAYHMVTVQGTSPLTLDAEDLELEPGDSVWITVDTPRLTPSPIYAKAQHQQAFHVTGSLVPVLEA